MKKTLVFGVIILGIISNVISQGVLNSQREKLEPYLYPFYHGVASGDPLTDAVVLWTRFTDDTFSLDSVKIEWRIATDTSMINVVNSGYGYTNENKDWTFKVDADGLSPDTYYFYDFKAQDNYSIRGRTKTAPSGDIDSVRFAVVSCSNWQHGYFHAYRHLVMRNDFDCVLHLGDYIYEYEDGTYSANISDRTHEPVNEIVSLEDYRIRYSQYRLDEDLRDLHQQFPFIMVWDDHESADNSYKDGAENHTQGSEGTWTDRKNNSTQAYHEWLPIRTPDLANKTKIYRKFSWGDLIDLHMLDTRLIGRSEQNNSYSDPNKTLLGTDQYNWLTNNLQNSNARWNILGQQVMMAPLEAFGIPVNNDQWDGYDYERNQLFNFITNNAINNFVVLTGDIHTSWVNDIPLSNYDASGCQNSLGVEYVVTSVTSASTSFSAGTSIIRFANPHIQYVDMVKKGYMILDVSKTKVQGDYYYMNDVEDPAIGEYYGDGYFVNHNEKCANQAAGPTQRLEVPPVYAPDMPMGYHVDIKDFSPMLLLGVYPNPTTGNSTIQLFIEKSSAVNIYIVDAVGKVIVTKNYPMVKNGMNYINIDLQNLPAGIYNVVCESSMKKVSKTVIKQ
ncbi:MAG: alkaline phosphatase D family protein [Flavobacteriales bacterium]|jgi:alkaline phosphatase D|nr:alkaline phosphatase D family protein [Flavobacteriales bacterium]